MVRQAAKLTCWLCCVGSGSSDNLESLAANDAGGVGRRSQDGNRASLGDLGSRGSSMDGLSSAAG